VKSGLKGFEGFYELIEFPLEPYMRRIVRAYFGKSREVVAVLPRGNAKLRTDKTPDPSSAMGRRSVRTGHRSHPSRKAVNAAPEM
jgi:hypothetical protein